MKFLNFKSGIAALGLLIVSINGFAQTATVTFSGTVTASTCVLTVNGTTVTGSAATVSLPTYSSSILAAAAGTTSPSTSFTMGVSSCSTTATPYLYLSAPNITTYSSKTLITSGITGVGFELLDSTSTTIALSTTPTRLTTLSSVSSTTTTASATYYVRYMSTATSITAGSSTSSATLTVTLYYS